MSKFPARSESGSESDFETLDSDSPEVRKYSFKKLLNEISASKIKGYKHNQLFKADSFGPHDLEDIDLFFKFERDEHWQNYNKEITLSLGKLEDVSQYYYQTLWDKYRNTELFQRFISPTPSKKLILEEVLNLVKTKGFEKSSSILAKEIGDFLTYEAGFLGIVDKTLQKDFVKTLLKSTKSAVGTEIAIQVIPSLIRTLPATHSSTVKAFIKYLPILSKSLVNHDALEKWAPELAKFFITTSKSLQKAFLQSVVDTEEMLLFFLKKQQQFFAKLDPVLCASLDQLPLVALYKARKINKIEYELLAKNIDKDKIVDKALTVESPTGDGFDPVYALLTKITTTKTVKDSGFDIEFVRMLKDVASKDKEQTNILHIVLKSAVLNGVIVLQGDSYISTGGSHDYGYTNPEGDIAVAAKNPILLVLSTTLHELAHKLAKFTFNNDHKPYFKNNEKSKKELETQDTVLKAHPGLSAYKASEHHTESIAHFVGELVAALSDLTYNKDQKTLLNSPSFVRWMKQHALPVFKGFSDSFDEIQACLPTYNAAPTGLVLDYTGGLAWTEIVGETPIISFVE